VWRFFTEGIEINTEKVIKIQFTHFWRQLEQRHTRREIFYKKNFEFTNKRDKFIIEFPVQLEILIFFSLEVRHKQRVRRDFKNFK
jgi:hypothetical protein